MPGRQVISVVPLDNVWVVANYKETQLTHVAIGQRAEIRVDTFPGIAINAIVDSIAPASGAQFSLLPPDNATGNFTKVVQRIPVKLRISPDNPLAGKLRPGMSVDRDDPHRHHTATAMTVPATAAAAPMPLPAIGRCEYPVVGVVAVMIGAFISTLNARITTQGLADIRGALGLGFDDGSWISTIFSRRANGRHAGGGMDEHRAQHPPGAAVDRRDLCRRLRCCRRSCMITTR